MFRIAARSLGRRAFAPRAAFRAQSFRAFSSVYYTPEHEYVKVDGKTGIIGVSNFAQEQLGDVVYVELPEVGDEFDKGDVFGSVESVKASSSVYMPVGGTVTETNTELDSDQSLVNSAAETDGWMVKVDLADESQLEGLMDEAAYEKYCEEEAQ